MIEKEELLEQAAVEFWRSKLLAYPTFDLAKQVELTPGALQPGAPWQQVPLPPAIAAQVKVMTKQSPLLEYCFYQTVLSILVHKYTGAEKVVIGNTPLGLLDGDVSPEAGRLVFHRSKIQPGHTFKQLFGALKEEVIATANFQHLPYGKLEELLGAPALKQWLELGLHVEGITPADPLADQFSLLVTIRPGDDACLRIEGRGSGWNERLAGNFLRNYLVLLQSVIGSPYQPVEQLEYLNEAERQELLVHFNNTRAAFPAGQTVHELFEQQVQARPEATAVVFEDRVVTYRLLNERSNQLAHCLAGRYGIAPGDLVGVMMDRSEWMITALMGILKAGAAYVPIDPEYPRSRVEYILQDAGVKALLRDEQSRPEGAPDPALPVVYLGGAAADLPEWSKENPALRSQPGDLIYVMYTSGSTGRPKGVMLTHRGIVNRLDWMWKKLRYTHGDVVLQKTTYTFDVSVPEIFMPLCYGAKVVVCRKEDVYDPALLCHCINRHGVTSIHFVPSLFNAFLDSLTAAQLPALASLRLVMTSGEELKGETVRQHFSKLNLPLYNLYGPTEASVEVTACHVQPADRTISIGSPIANTEIFILDANRQLVPAGVYGEICIAGVGLARGYLNQPEQTREKFFANPYADAGVLYATGDIGCWLPDGTIRFRGRRDSQVKIRGYRIETGEVENTIKAYDNVDDAVVVCRGNEADGRYLAAYFTSRQAVEPAALSAYLAARLPGYMVPPHLVPVKAFPLSSNGKLDVNALPDPAGARPSTYAAPRTETETAMAAVWQAVLGKDRIGLDDDFILLGGDSIMAIQVSSRMRTLGYKLEVTDILKHSRFADLSVHVRTVEDSSDQSQVTGTIPLTPIQKQFFAHVTRAPHHFNQAVLLQAADRLSREELEAVFLKIWAHHDALRMTYTVKSGEWTQENQPAEAPLELLEYELRGGADEKKALEARAQELQAGFVLDRGPLMKLALFHLSDADRLLIIVHHLVIDGVSWRILFEDIDRLCRQYRQGSPLELPDKTQSFKAWAQQLRNYARSNDLPAQLPYWKTLFEKGGNARFGRLTNADAPSLGETSSRRVRLSRAVTQKLLTDVHRAYRTDINDVLLAALGLSVGAMWQSERVLVWREGHGRENPGKALDVSRTVGWFTSFYPVLLEVNEQDDYGTLLIRTKENLHGIPNKGFDYGILQYLHEAGNLPVPAAGGMVFNYLGSFDRDLSQTAFTAAPESAGNTASESIARNCDWEITSVVSEGCLEIAVSFSRNHYPEDTVALFCDTFKKHLEGLAEHCLGRSGATLTASDLTYKGLTPEALDHLRSLYGPVEDVYELSPMQTGIILPGLLDGASTAYLVQTVYELEEALDIALVEQSLQALVKRHTMLRTAFYLDHAPNLQVVLKERQVAFRYEDLEYLDGSSARYAYIEDFRARNQRKVFDLQRDVLLRVTIFRVAPNRHVFSWSHHAVLMDGWCRAVMVAEYRAIYQGLLHRRNISLPDVHPYSTYISWLNRYDTHQANAYWREYLAGYGASVAVPGLRREVPANAYRLEEFVVALTEHQTHGLKKLAADHAVTLNTLVQALWGCLLGKYNNCKDVVYGVVVSGRPPEVEGIEQMIGLFINTVPVRVSWANGMGFAQVLAGLHRANLASAPYHYGQLSEVQACSALNQDLINHILIFENYPVESPHPPAAGTERNAQISGYQEFQQTNYDFNIMVMPQEKIFIKYSFNANAYDARLLRRTAGHLQRLVDQVIETPGIPIEKIDILGAGERQQLLYDFNATATGYAAGQKIHQLFEARARLTPEAPAVVHGTVTLSYRQLNERANQLAHYLIAEKAVKPHDLVGLMVERSEWMVVGMMGILKAGAAYVPIDPDYPAKRRAYIVDNSGIRLVLANPGLVPAAARETYVLLDDGAFDGLSRQNPEMAFSSRALAYVIYTSGSTGRPKGVMVQHHSVVNLVEWVNRSFDVGSHDTVLCVTSMCFDLSVYDVFGTLAAGGKLVVADKEQIGDPSVLVRLMRQEGVTFWNSVPSTINHLTLYLHEHQPGFEQGALRLVFMSGDWIPLPLPDRIRKYFPGARVISLGGATEGTVWSNYYPIGAVKPEWRSIPYGTPISNNYFYVLDNDQNPVPEGSVGNLYIGGVGVATGYINDEQKTRAAFFADPFHADAGGRMYKTGDLGRMMEDGNLEILGREDSQLKIRGFRVELGEIEHVLHQHPAIREGVVIAAGSEPGGKYLLAFYVSDEEVLAAGLRKYLRESLPEYMIPAQLMRVSAVPLNVNGKVDRNVLLAQADAAFNGHVRWQGPRDGTEEVIVAVWNDLLQKEKISIYDNFFEIGGHSLKATQMLLHLNSHFNVKLDLRKFFLNPTVEALAEEIKRINWVSAAPVTAVDNQQYDELII